ncbi:hypothetical protein BDR05DRAFT_495679 [Suillus weaverae]|nr:hypothetical protein BDR05DRAFT_495679 [Suillus weaverae]
MKHLLARTYHTASTRLFGFLGEAVVATYLIVFFILVRCAVKILRFGRYHDVDGLSTIQVLGYVSEFVYLYDDDDDDDVPWRVSYTVTSSLESACLSTHNHQPSHRLIIILSQNVVSLGTTNCGRRMAAINRCYLSNEDRATLCNAASFFKASSSSPMRSPIHRLSHHLNQIIFLLSLSGKRSPHHHQIRSQMVVNR